MQPPCNSFRVCENLKLSNDHKVKWTHYKYFKKFGSEGELSFICSKSTKYPIFIKRNIGNIEWAKEDKTGPRTG